MVNGSSSSERKTEKELIEEDSPTRTETIHWTELNETVKSNTAKAFQHCL